MTVSILALFYLKYVFSGEHRRQVRGHVHELQAEQVQRADQAGGLEAGDGTIRTMCVVGQIMGLVEREQACRYRRKFS